MGTASIGASIGVAETEDPTESPADLLRRADELMYEDKQSHGGGR
jgi:PleD family two-component response regulator